MRSTNDVDSAIGAGGALSKVAIPLISPLTKEGPGGGRYFTLFDTVSSLAIARAALRKMDYEKCAASSFSAITNLTIAMLTSIGRFDVVDQYDHKKSDPRLYVERAIEAMRSKGAKTADRWVHVYLLARAAEETVPRLPDATSKRLGANAGLALAAVAPVRFNVLCQEMGVFDESTFGGLPQFAELAALGRP